VDSPERASNVSVVRVALGWRAREVEERSSPGVQRFSDQDLGVIILERDPSALAYADPTHAFTLPAGRFLRLDQAAGRVFEAKATPHLDALTATAASVLIDSVARLLEGAGWQRVPGAGSGAGALREAAEFAASGKRGFGVMHVGTWRVRRPPAPWAALPAGARAYPDAWDGVECTVTVRPTGAATRAEDARMILQVRVEDELLSIALQAQADARRSRHGGRMQTLRSWDEQPHEALVLSP
jgi:hypothetical protein